MTFRKRLTIIPDIPPQTKEDICCGIAMHCAEFNLPYEFLCRSYPVVAIIDGHKYEFTKKLTRRWLATFLALYGREVG